jgi:hypothetical protein
MVDASLNVWLIEVNSNPCLELASPYLATIIPRLLEHVMQLTVDVAFPGTRPSVASSIRDRDGTGGCMARQRHTLRGGGPPQQSLYCHLAFLSRTQACTHAESMWSQPHVPHAPFAHPLAVAGHWPGGGGGDVRDGSTRRLGTSLPSHEAVGAAECGENRFVQVY